MAATSSAVAAAMSAAAASSAAALPSTPVRVDVITYGLIRSDAMLAANLPTLESVVLFPLLRRPEFSTRLHVHVFCLKPQCDHRGTRVRFTELNATTLSIVHRRKPPPDKYADNKQLNYFSAMDSLWTAMQRALDPSGPTVPKKNRGYAPGRRLQVFEGRYEDPQSYPTLEWLLAQDKRINSFKRHVVLVTRVDVRFMAIPPPGLGSILAKSKCWEEREMVYVPSFGHYGGLNDRFAFGHAGVIEQFVKFRHQRALYIDELGAEAMACAVIHENSFRVMRVPEVMFVRVRADLKVPDVDRRIAEKLPWTANWMASHELIMCPACFAQAYWRRANDTKLRGGPRAIWKRMKDGTIVVLRPECAMLQVPTEPFFPLTAKPNKRTKANSGGGGGALWTDGEEARRKAGVV